MLQEITEQEIKEKKLKIYPEYEFSITTKVHDGSILLVYESWVNVENILVPIMYNGHLSLETKENKEKFFEYKEKLFTQFNRCAELTKLNFKYTNYDVIDSRGLPFIFYKIKNKNDAEDIEQRASGRSTRLLDSYIQELFKNKSAEVIDHDDAQQSHSLLCNKLIQRLINEHQGVRFEIIYPNKIKLK